MTGVALLNAKLLEMSDQMNKNPLSRFLPFIRFSLYYPGHGMYLNIRGGSSTAPVTGILLKTDTDEQRFSFEAWENYFYIRNCLSKKYLTADILRGIPNQPSHGFGIKQDYQYNGHDETNKLIHRYQQWKFTPLQVSGETNLFIISSAYFPNMILQPRATSQPVAPLVLVTVPDIVTGANAWKVIPFN